MAKESILITGGAGFIGRRLVHALLQKDAGQTLVVFDSLHPQVHGSNPSPPSFPAGVKFVRGDVGDPAAVRAVVKENQPSTVYHLAAETGTGQSYDEPTRYCHVNVVGTTHLVEALREVKSARRVVLAASRAVYGEGAYRDADDRECTGLPRLSEAMQAKDFSVSLPPGFRAPAKPAPSHAGTTPAPASIYASTKLMQEHILAQAGDGASWQAVLLRFQNVYGPGQSLKNPYTGVLSIFSRQLLEGKTLDIYEDGDIARDFVFVDDVADALVRAGAQKVPHGTICDIGSGRAETILKVAKILMRELSGKEDRYRITGAFRAGDIRHACADIRRARELLGWNPRVTLESGLSQLAAWAKQAFQAGNL